MLFQISIRSVYPPQPQVLSSGPHLVHLTRQLTPHLLCVPTSQTSVGLWLWPQRVPATSQRQPPPRQPIQVRTDTFASRLQKRRSALFFLTCIFLMISLRVLPDLHNSLPRKSPITVRQELPRRVNSPVRAPPPGQYIHTHSWCTLYWYTS